MDEGSDSPGRDDATSQRLIKVAETLVEQLDTAAAFVLDHLVDDVLRPVRAARMGAWVLGALLLFLGIFGLAAPETFRAYLPYILGGGFTLGAVVVLYTGVKLGELERRLTTWVDKARTWKKVGSWARRFMGR